MGTFLHSIQLKTVIHCVGTDYHFLHQLNLCYACAYASLPDSATLPALAATSLACTSLGACSYLANSYICDYLRDGDGQIAVFQDYNEAVRVLNFLNQIPVRRTWGYIVEEAKSHVSGRSLEERRAGFFGG